MKYTYLSYIRILAIIFVVFYHSYCPYGQWGWIKTARSSFEIINHFLEPFVAMMPLLTFISGFLFYSIRYKYTSFNYLLKKKFERLIIPMILIGTIYYLMFESTLSISIHTINSILSGYGVLWYCNMLFLCFVVAYPITKHIKTAYLKLLILLISFGLIYINVPAILGLNSLTHFFFYFYFGFVFSELVSKYKTLSSKKVVVIIGVLFVVNYILYEYNSIFEMNSKLMKILSGNILRISFILFIVLLLKKYEPKLKYTSVVRFLDQNSFGCYVFHYPVLYFLYKTKLFEISSLNHYWYFPVCVFTISTVVAYAGTYLFRKSKVGVYLLG